MELKDIVPVSEESTVFFKTGRWSPYKAAFEEKISPCTEACPVGTDIPEVMWYVTQGLFDEALALLLEENPLPGVCGRVCFHPCQGACNRLDLDKGLKIREVERAVADLGKALPQAPVSFRDVKVAVVGSGPAGISAAYFLRKLGYSVEVFERKGQAGGMLRFGIPEYRLPKAVLERELQRLIPLGIRFNFEVSLDGQGIERLLGEYAAVVLSTGLWSPRRLGLKGEGLKGVYYGIHWLSEPPKLDQAPRSVVVIGGGDVAVDAARVSRRRFPHAVVKIVAPEQEGEFPALPEGLSEAVEEGIEVIGGFKPLEFRGDDRLKGVVFERVRVQKEELSGQYLFIPVGGIMELEAELAIICAGQTFDKRSIPEGVLGEKGRPLVDRYGRTTLRGLYLAGDLTASRPTVVEALSSGKRVALAIHAELLGEDPEVLFSEVRLGEGKGISFRGLNGKHKTLRKVARPKETARLLVERVWDTPEPKRLPLGERVSTFLEVNLGMSESQAMEEAKRCLVCGKCVKCDLCFLCCPDLAVIKGERYRSDEDYCKGCGICVEVCPRNVWELEG